MRVWRISNYADLSGRGGELAAGRWNNIGVPVVYCADHPALALLEILVHVDAEDLPERYQLLEIEVPDDVTITQPELPSKWRKDLRATRRIGSNFIRDAPSAVMKVPSILIPHGYNFLINPRLSGDAGIVIANTTLHPFDDRLLR